MGQETETHLGDVSHERAVWKIEHWGWAMFALILLSALAGVFGDGPVARAKARNAAIGVEYDRLVRYQAPSTLKVRLARSGNSSMPALSVSQSFIERVEVQHITPEPERVKGAHNSLIYIFDVAQTNEEITVTIGYKPRAYGKTAVRLGRLDGPQLQFTQFFYP
jgi:hypothetical protein